jgi:hypothetical protein
MTKPEASRHVEVKDGDHIVADAEVSASAEPGGTARATLRAASGHIAPGSRASLVDAVMDMPEVQGSSRLEAAIPSAIASRWNACANAPMTSRRVRLGPPRWWTPRFGQRGNPGPAKATGLTENHQPVAEHILANAAALKHCILD